MINRYRIFFYLFLLFLISSVNLTAQQLQSDNGDGTYTNPVIYVDFPDPDVIDVDSYISLFQLPCLYSREVKNLYYLNNYIK